MGGLRDRSVRAGLGLVVIGASAGCPSAPDTASRPSWSGDPAAETTTWEIEPLGDSDDDGAPTETDGAPTTDEGGPGDTGEDGMTTGGQDELGEASSSGEGDAAEEPTPPACPDPQMIRFPVATDHNIGYDPASCGTGTCDVSCPDLNANSDWNAAAGHHGIDIFAHEGAPLVAVAEATVVRVGVVSATSGLRVRIRDVCGWEYYYGHLDEATVVEGQSLQAGQQLGTMGASGTQSVHLHFNVSWEGNYNDDIDPFSLLDDTSATACE